MAINTVTLTFKLMFTLNLLLVGFCKSIQVLVHSSSRKHIETGNTIAVLNSI